MTFNFIVHNSEEAGELPKQSLDAQRNTDTAAIMTKDAEPVISASDNKPATSSAKPKYRSPLTFKHYVSRSDFNKLFRWFHRLLCIS